MTDGVRSGRLSPSLPEGSQGPHRSRHLGEEVVIAKAGKPVARLVPFAAKPMRRVAGSARGQVWMAPDFNAPLPDEL